MKVSDGCPSESMGGKMSLTLKPLPVVESEPDESVGDALGQTGSDPKVELRCVS